MSIALPLSVQMSREEEDCLFAMQLASSSVLPMIMKSAFDLDIFQIIARAGVDVHLSPLEIASQINNNNNPDAPVMLDRILRLLASYSVLTSSLHTTTTTLGDSSSVQIRLYGLAPVCKYFIKNQDGVSLAPLMVLIHDKVFMDNWYYVKDAVLEGRVPFDKVHGVHAFKYPGIDPRFNEVFNIAMYNHTTLIMKKILDKYKGFEGLKEVVDVGGGIGTAINLVASKYPSIKATNFDLPHVVKDAPSYPGVVHVGGDMFASVPKGEAIFMKWILHDWSDDHCSKLLKNCYEALPEDSGKVIAVEAILPVAAETDAAAKGLCQMDLMMMTQYRGKERTQDEFVTLAKRAGFKGIRLEYCVCNFWVMEFYK